MLEIQVFRSRYVQDTAWNLMIIFIKLGGEISIVEKLTVNITYLSHCQVKN